MTVESRYRLGMSAFAAGDDEEVISRLAPLAGETDSPRAALCRYYLARAHYRLGTRLFNEGRFAEAARHFQTAQSLNDLASDLAGYLARCYLHTGQDAQAAEHLETLLKRRPGDVQVRIQLALTRYRQGDFDAAVTILEQGLDYPTPHAELHYQLGILAAAREDYLRAERSFERAILADPTHAAAHERLAQVCSVNGRSERVLPLLQRAHELDPHNARIALQITLLAQTGGLAGKPPQIFRHPPERAIRFDKDAIEKLTQAITAEPEFVEAFLSLPETEVDREVFSMLAAILEHALRDHPEYADLHYHCGAVYKRLGRRLDAIHHTERAVAINPHYVRALIQLATLYAQTDQWAMGVERLEQALQAGGDDPDVHRLLGELYAVGGQPERARRAYRRALELDHNDRVAREALEALST